MAKENTGKKMELYMKDNLKIIKLKALVLILGQMEDSIKENG